MDKSNYREAILGSLGLVIEELGGVINGMESDIFYNKSISKKQEINEQLSRVYITIQYLISLKKEYSEIEDEDEE